MFHIFLNSLKNCHKSDRSRGPPKFEGPISALEGQLLENTRVPTAELPQVAFFTSYFKCGLFYFSPELLPKIKMNQTQKRFTKEVNTPQQVFEIYYNAARIILDSALPSNEQIRKTSDDYWLD